MSLEGPACALQSCRRTFLFRLGLVDKLSLQVSCHVCKSVDQPDQLLVLAKVLYDGHDHQHDQDHQQAISNGQSPPSLPAICPTGWALLPSANSGGNP